MMIRKSLSLMGVAAFAAWASQASAVITIDVGDATVDQGGTAAIAVTLSGVAAGGVLANNAQLDILYDDAAFDVTSGPSTCTIDARLAALNHTESTPTSPAPPAGKKRLRLNVIDSLEPLGGVTDGVLFNCNFKVKANAPAGASTLTATRLNVGDTAGAVLPSQGSDGTVTINGGAVECPAPTPIATPASGIFIQVGGVTQAVPGGSASFAVTLNGVAAGGTLANNAQLDIIFPSAVFNVTAGSVCTIDTRLAALNHTESLPASPNPGEGNQRLRLNVIDSLEPLGGVTDGVLFNCVFPVKAGATAGDVTTLNGVRVNVGDVSGGILASGDAAAIDGLVVVCPDDGPTPVPATATPTATATPSTPPTNTATAVVTATRTNPPATATAARTATSAPATPGTLEDEDGCQMTTRATGSGWALLIPAMMVVALRRRSH